MATSFMSDVHKLVASVIGSQMQEYNDPTKCSKLDNTKVLKKAVDDDLLFYSTDLYKNPSMTPDKLPPPIYHTLFEKALKKHTPGVKCSSTPTPTPSPFEPSATYIAKVKDLFGTTPPPSSSLRSPLPPGPYKTGDVVRLIRAADKSLPIWKNKIDILKFPESDENIKELNENYNLFFQAYDGKEIDIAWSNKDESKSGVFTIDPKFLEKVGSTPASGSSKTLSPLGSSESGSYGLGFGLGKFFGSPTTASSSPTTELKRDDIVRLKRSAKDGSYPVYSTYNLKIAKEEAEKTMKKSSPVRTPPSKEPTDPAISEIKITNDGELNTQNFTTTFKFDSIDPSNGQAVVIFKSIFDSDWVGFFNIDPIYLEKVSTNPFDSAAMGSFKGGARPIMTLAEALEGVIELDTQKGGFNEIADELLEKKYLKYKEKYLQLKNKH